MWIRLLVVIELVIGYGVVFYMWVLGVIALPLVLFTMFLGAGFSALPLVLAVFFGGFALWGVMQLVMKIFDPAFNIADIIVIRFYLCLGLSAFAIIIEYVKFNLSYSFVIFGPPLFVTAHLIYLERRNVLKAS